MTNKSAFCLLHLSLLPHIGPSFLRRLQIVLEKENAPIDVIYGWRFHDFVQRLGVSEQVAGVVVAGLADKNILDKELALIEKNSIAWATCLDEGYPALLKAIHAPPLVLYWRGVNPADLDRPLAVIGSRKANDYGRRIIYDFVHDFVAAGCSIVSGGALGADTYAHKAALQESGKTCAVIGAGLLKPYPASNRSLFDAIVDGGGSLVSPFPLLMGALPGNFPARNRIISGLSVATVVVQAAEKSGARITALYALEQGREVCAVPGSIEDPLSAGCHRLMMEGATVATSGAAVLEACGYVDYVPVVSFGQMSAVPQKDLDPLVALCREPQTFDELLGQTNYDFADLQGRLLELQLAGNLQQDFMGRWHVGA